MTRFLILLMIIPVSAVITFPAVGHRQEDAVLFQSDSGDNGTAWRHTRFGWEDSTHWEPVTDLRPELVPGMHPLAWAGLLTLSVLVLLVWASEEDEVAQLAPSIIATHQRRTGPQKTVAAENMTKAE